ncbi:MAG: hypothetical protein ACTSRP_07335 [Candidatus Helarchaeota archaeon]
MVSKKEIRNAVEIIFWRSIVRTARKYYDFSKDLRYDGRIRSSIDLTEIISKHRLPLI